MAVVGIRRRVENAAGPSWLRFATCGPNPTAKGRVAVRWFWAVLPYGGRRSGAGVHYATKVTGNAFLVDPRCAPFWHPVPK
jgi:hypothetical protein